LLEVPGPRIYSWLGAAFVVQIFLEIGLMILPVSATLLYQPSAPTRLKTFDLTINAVLLAFQVPAAF